MTSRLDLPKVFDFQSVEARQYAAWEDGGHFKPHPAPDRSAFVISIPPPNVTGELHLGHALFVTLEDLMIRYHRMRGEPALWVPGTDHAGIATQKVVEDMLAREGTSRHTLGREAFLARVWEWKEKYGNTIIQQLRMLGASCDWDRTRFTLDEGLSRAVREVFVRLWDEDLLYRAARMINWCPRCGSAVSDLEVEHETQAGTLTYIRYPVVAEPGDPAPERFVTVATTRPETLLGDTGVAVHPDDSRYADLVGRTVSVPVIGREIPIVADHAVEPAFGTGAVKVTPAHDPTDFAIAQRHNLPHIQVIGFDGAMTEAAGPYEGLDRFAARRRLVQDLQQRGLIEKIEDYQISIGLCQRCETVIEPLVSTQWFVRMKPLAGPAAAAVRYGQLTIVPERFARVYLHWMDTIQDWCISRQLWWGHRIPAWYCDGCGRITVTREDPEACVHCGSTAIARDPDVLDTWFSSWLWPFSTLGWPEATEDLRLYYPTSVLETGYDILFFWVARMVFAGQHFTGTLPFHTVYLHGLVRDRQGRKMSKTIGNVIDPRELMRQYGTDALRFTLATGGTPGNDIKLDPRRVEDGRNFVTKIWNAARFVLAQQVEDARPTPPATIADRWLRSRLARVTMDVTRLIDTFQFGEAGRQAHDFFWSEYCDWYLEIAKVQLQADTATQASTRWSLLQGLDTALRLLHPFIPFVTEEIWQHLPERGERLIVAPWPQGGERDEEAERSMALVVDAIRFVRTVRADLRIDPVRRLPLLAVTAHHGGLLHQVTQAVETLARVDLTIHTRLGQTPQQAVHLALPGLELYLPLEGIVDLETERARMAQELGRLESAIDALQARLANPQFTGQAPETVVRKERDRLAEMQALLRTIQERIVALQG